MLVLVRNDGGASLYLDGALSLNEARDGRITDHAQSTGRFVVDGRTIRPSFATIDSWFSPFPMDRSLTQGQERISEIKAWVADVQETGTLLSIQTPGQPLFENFALESATYSQTNNDALRSTLSLKEVRFARTRSASLTQLTSAAKNKGGKPVAANAAGLAPETDRGTQPTQTLLVQGVDFVGSFIP